MFSSIILANEDSDGFELGSLASEAHPRATEQTLGRFCSIQKSVNFLMFQSSKSIK